MDQSPQHQLPPPAGITERECAIAAVDSWAIAAPEYLTGAWVIVRIRTRGGVEGFGECYVPDRAGRAILAGKSIIDTTFRDAILGEPALDLTRLWHKIYDLCKRMYDRRGIAIHALSGIDIALHDAAARTLGIPVYQLLGGRTRSSIQLYASCIHIDVNRFDVSLADACHYSALGYRVIKFWGWPDFGQDEAGDVQRLRDLQDAVGQNVRLMLDLGRPGSMPEAQRLVRMIGRSGVDLLGWEEPFSSVDQRQNLIDLAATSSVPIATGEAEKTTQALRDLIHTRRFAAIQPDLSLVGGLTEGRRIAELACLDATCLAPHNWGTIVNFAASLHLLSAAPGTAICEHPISGRVPTGDRHLPSPVMTDIAGHGFEVINGTATLPADTVGLGLEVDAAVLDRLSI
ncbi:mandelate racemase/muconate lactonizing enzyme family protein [Mesorhizobium sp. M1329]|uniref:mandelate racemase/muconate lactonizing enzyme family protein n=1 Tax=Mesorhizobium sp. M1329 TaxID=2957083 RepID=UPI003339AC75